MPSLGRAPALALARAFSADAAAAPKKVVIPESEYQNAELLRTLDPSADRFFDDDGAGVAAAHGGASLSDRAQNEAPAHLRNVKMDGSTRRFYDEVSVTPEGSGTFALRLGGHVVMTPDDRPLVLPSKHYALLAALEFENQTTFVYPHTMPLTYLAVSVLDRVPRDRALLTETVLNILQFDSTLYRDDCEDSMGLVRLQEKYWDPILDWLSEAHGIVFEPTYGMTATAQPAGSAAKFAALVTALDDWQLAAMEELTSIGKSAIVALAFLHREIDVDRAFRAMRLEETFQLNVSGRVEGVYGTQIPEEHTKLRLAALRTAMNLRDFKL
jgi:ATP synthase F1 complex assembly factor 2